MIKEKLLFEGTTGTAPILINIRFQICGVYFYTFWGKCFELSKNNSLVFLAENNLHNTLTSLGSFDFHKYQ